MNIHTQSSDSTHVDEFRTAHMIWKKANDSFHDRFQEIVTARRNQDLDILAQDLAHKFDHFIKCSKALVAGG
jgi:hypothetical protein